MRARVLVLGASLAAGALACSLPPNDADGGNDGGTDVAPPVCTCPVAGVTVANLPLACLCTSGDVGMFLCSQTVADVMAESNCNDGSAAFQNMGCGEVSYEPGGSFAGNVLTFGSSGRNPIGVFQTSDAPFGPCAAGGVTTYVYGQALLPATHPAATAADACPGITGCVICGGNDVPGPRCM